MGPWNFQVFRRTIPVHCTGNNPVPVPLVGTVRYVAVPGRPHRHRRTVRTGSGPSECQALPHTISVRNQTLFLVSCQNCYYHHVGRTLRTSTKRPAAETEEDGAVGGEENSTSHSLSVVKMWWTFQKRTTSAADQSRCPVESQLISRLAHAPCTVLLAPFPPVFYILFLGGGVRPWFTVPAAVPFLVSPLLSRGAAKEGASWEQTAEAGGQVTRRDETAGGSSDGS